MRYLALDVGARRIGLAVGESIASELTTIESPKGVSHYEQPEVALSKLKEIVSTEKIDELVVGLPVNELGEMTSEAEKISKFCTLLEAELKLPVHQVDETLTSFMAEEMLREQGLPAEQVNKRKDQLAATLILDQYLEEDAAA